MHSMKFGPVVRIIEVYFAAVMVTVLGYALLMPANDFKYDITLIRVLVVMAAASRSLWLIERRASTTRQYVVVSMLIVIALSLLDLFYGGEYARIAAVVSLPVLIAGGVLYFAGSFAIVAFFAFSPHAKELFVEPIHTSVQPTSNPGENIYEKPFTWPWFRNLVIYYCVFSVVGHWAEIGFCWLIVLGIFDGSYDFSHAQLWEQWLYPYPAEGIAVVLIVIFLFPLKEWLLKKFNGRLWPTLIASFFANAVVCVSIDFLMGITTNADYQLWDYRDMPFNFMGQIVLQNSLVYTIAATLFVWVVYPLMAKALHRAPQHYVNGMFFGLLGIYAFLEILYYVHVGPRGLIFG